MNNGDRSPDSQMLKAIGLTKNFKLDKTEIQVLRGIDIEVKKGEFISIIGPSGAGKSTLLHILGTLESPTDGELHLNGRNITSLKEDEKSQLRRGHIGFIFQFHHLLPGFSALENVAIAALVNKRKPEEAFLSSEELLRSFGLGERLKNKPAELSGGEQQRVAVARALVNNPSLILADEPTGNLDRSTGRALEEEMARYAQEQGTAIIVVTHNDEWAKKADRVLTLEDGYLG
ncbi:MAG: ABC transporter ATP-binding protein [Candidatus Electryonea clarkiae]|nr:ABC transporter ATP-binding protein [Candidatus Electryonea clarkiae]MDP8285881.1 ABC transporter ATP-binding protein [Candidatus Electryonea clarkiae]